MGQQFHGNVSEVTADPVDDEEFENTASKADLNNQERIEEDDGLTPEERILNYLREQGIAMTPDLERFILKPPTEHDKTDARQKIVNEIVAMQQADTSYDALEKSLDSIYKDIEKYYSL